MILDKGPVKSLSVMQLLWWNIYLFDFVPVLRDGVLCVKTGVQS